MEADLSRLPTGASGWRALVDYATALGDLTEVYWFELKGRLSFSERSSRKRSAATVSRAILGMSNRMPDLAQKYMGGHGVVLVGIENETVVGTEQVDGAQLWDAVEPFVGEDGPHWDYQFVNHPDGLVLAVVVDPPKWGDRIHACRREFQDSETKLSLRDGDIFVRVPGKNRPATSRDVSQLEQRRLKAPDTGAKVRVDYDATFDRVDAENVQGLVEDVVDAKADALLASLPSYPVSTGFTSAWPTAMSIDGRSPEDFRAEVEEWREESKELVDEVVDEFFRFHLARGRLLIHNESVRYLEGVRVQVTFPPGVVVLMGSDTEYCDHGGGFRAMSMLPNPPYKYGDQIGHISASFNSNMAFPAVTSPAAPFEVEHTSDGPVITWLVGDLPSTKSETGSEQFAVFTAEHVTEIAAGWTVTARGVDHVFQGELRLDCEQDPGVHRRWGRMRQG